MSNKKSRNLHDNSKVYEFIRHKTESLSYQTLFKILCNLTKIVKNVLLYPDWLKLHQKKKKNLKIWIEQF